MRIGAEEEALEAMEVVAYECFQCLASSVHLPYPRCHPLKAAALLFLFFD